MQFKVQLGKSKLYWLMLCRRWQIGLQLNSLIETCKTFEWDVSQDLETTLEDMSSSIIISLT